VIKPSTRPAMINRGMTPTNSLTAVLPLIMKAALRETVPGLISEKPIIN